MALLGNGRVIVAGGNLAYNTATENYKGLNRVYTFNPRKELWKRQPDMLHGRWYPTVTELADGRAFVTSGFDENGGAAYNDDVDVFTPLYDHTGRISVGRAGIPDGSGNIRIPRFTFGAFYPHQFVLPNGKVLIAGPSQFDTGILKPAANLSEWTYNDVKVPNMLMPHRNYSSAVLLPGRTGGPTKVMIIGGANGGALSASLATTATEMFDNANKAAGWQLGVPLPQPRHNANTVILPDGKLLLVGGNTENNTSGLPQREALMYDPAAPAWIPMATQSEQRAYHSTALLLPDARVLSAGDSTPTGGGSTNDMLEIYSPPYLFQPNGQPAIRPLITSAPTRLTWGQPFFIGTSGSVTRAVLIPPTATTHANNMTQRYVSLVISAAAGGVNAVAPPAPGVAPPVTTCCSCWIARASPPWLRGSSSPLLLPRDLA